MNFQPLINWLAGHMTFTLVLATVCTVWVVMTISDFRNKGE